MSNSDLVNSNQILVTGADGFIGSHLTEALVRAGHKVRAFTQYNSFNSWGWLDSCAKDVKGAFEVFSGDIRDPHGVRTAMRGCDTVFHLAALIAIPFSYHSPDSYVDTNIKGTLNILQAARDLKINRVIHTSTSEVYGSAQYVPIDEFHPLQGQSPYSASKIAADQLAYSFFSSFDLPVLILRPFNTFGPRQSARAVIPTIITQIANGTKEIELGLSTPTRDFTFVDDTVKGFQSALTVQDCFGEVINLGSNFEISILRTAELIKEIMESDVKITVKNERIRPENSEVSRLWSDNSKALDKLNWMPSLTGEEGFRSGLRQTIDWFLEPENLKLYKAELYNL